jgi:Xaa-Pro aminopeptidase
MLKQKAFETSKFDGYVVFDAFNLTYFTGLSGTSALLIPSDGKSVLFVYGVNYEAAKAEAEGFKVEEVKSGEKLTDKIVSQAATFRAKHLAFDVLDVGSWRILAKSLGGGDKLTVNGSFVRDLRKIKDEEEVKLMRKAAELSSSGMKVAYETLAAGWKEKDMAAEIEYSMRKRGSDGTSFETIVASGASSAYPHGGCSDRRIREGDLVVVDLGAKYKFYCSDMTRTLVAGRPTEKQSKLYRIVQEAYEKAFATIKPGAKGSDVDGAARETIEKTGYGEYFVHSLGHGVGLEVHEPPSLSINSKDILAAGNVVTDEPGIYLTGHGGFRVEDTVLVTKKGAEKLTEAPYQLTIR